jgi:hypothetical protein
MLRMLCCAVLLSQAHQAYKSDVLAFLKSLEPLAVAKLLRLPEPAWFPQLLATPPMPRKQQKPGSKPPADGFSTAALQLHKQRLELQSQSLADSWLAQQHEAAAAGGQAEKARGNSSSSSSSSSTSLSKLASLCLVGVPLSRNEGGAAAAAAGGGDGDGDDERLPLLTPPGTQQQQQQQRQQIIIGWYNTDEPRDYKVEYGWDRETDVLGDSCGVCCQCPDQRGWTRLAVCGGDLRADTSLDAPCPCRCHATAENLVQRLPSTDDVIDLLDHASEGTLLCNPRLLQQPHTASCTCHACAAPSFVPHAGFPPGYCGCVDPHSCHGWSEKEVLKSVAMGWDVVDVFAEHGVDDASLSYVVERRLITAYFLVGTSGSARVVSRDPSAQQSIMVW